MQNLRILIIWGKREVFPRLLGGVVIMDGRRDVGWDAQMTERINEVVAGESFAFSLTPQPPHALGTNQRPEEDEQKQGPENVQEFHHSGLLLRH